MAEIIETANNAYEERDKANDNIDSLRSKAKREAKEFENDLKEISKLAEQRRKAAEMLRNTNERKNERNESTELNVHAEKTNKNKSAKGLKNNTIDPQLQEKNHRLRADYMKIELTTGLKNFKSLADTFKEMEESNFEKFKYVIELSNQIEFIEHQIAEYRDEIKEFQGRGNSNTAMKNKHLKELDDLSLTCQNRSNYLEGKYAYSQRTLGTIT